MKEDCISTILNWPEPEFVCEVQSFLVFTTFYRRFVKGFSSIAQPLTDITKEAAQKTKKDLALRNKDFDAGGSQILSRVGSYFHHLSVPGSF